MFTLAEKQSYEDVDLRTFSKAKNPAFGEFMDSHTETVLRVSFSRSDVMMRRVAVSVASAVIRCLSQTPQRDRARWTYAYDFMGASDTLPVFWLLRPEAGLVTEKEPLLAEVLRRAWNQAFSDAGLEPAPLRIITPRQERLVFIIVRHAMRLYLQADATDYLAPETVYEVEPNWGDPRSAKRFTTYAEAAEEAERFPFSAYPVGVAVRTLPETPTRLSRLY